MEKENFDLFTTLIKMKSFLISLIDDPDECSGGLRYSAEYLERRHPEYAANILALLKANNITSDCDIAFDTRVHNKFRDIAERETSRKTSIGKILDNFRINHGEMEDLLEKHARYSTSRDKQLNAITEILFRLVKTWTVHKELEANLENYSELDEQEMIRPDEEKKLDILGGNTEISFGAISKLTNRYLELFTNYYFSYGGNISLDEFLRDLEYVKKDVARRYADLFQKHGLDADWINENLGEE